MSVHRIAIVSDTHGLLRPEIEYQLNSCELILHAGDVGKSAILESLREIAPVYAVCGNVDGNLGMELPEELEINLYGFRIYMIHNKRQMKTDISNVDFVIYGHSHKYEEKVIDSVTYLNPGSCGPRRFRLPITMMILTLDPEEHRFYVERVDCDCSSKRINEQASEIFPVKDMDRMIRKVIKEMNSGKAITEIAAGNHLEEELVEQICRIYVTHPGVDIQGIMNRMEIKDL